MPLAPRTRLGPYEITVPIGKGGMGEVYRARDTKLDRDVAIKVLPEEFASDAERLARFEREAKLLASLNHPGIATLHGLEKTEGKPALVMELVEGETLGERLALGRLSLEEVVALFRQIADALRAAHAKGIVHRDLKPANVKITPDGKVKILDFGLAKLAEADGGPSGESASHSPTLTRNTALGAILGTASYMSPEQARGKTVDKRTDIWAFGCCLFEVLAGRKAFDGETVADVLSKVLQREPEWSALPPGPPRALRRLMKKCLEKDPDRRIHDIADAGLELEESLSAPPAAESRLQSRTLVLAIAGAALAGALASFLLVRPTPAPRAVQRFSINLPPGDEFLVGGIEGPLVAISPDGSKVVYAGVRNGEAQLFLRPVDRDVAEPIAGTRNGRMPFFSPNGEWIGFSAGRELKKVAILGGAPVTLVQMEGADHRGGTWARDGRIFASIDGLLIWISEGGGPSTTMSLDEGVDEPAWTWPHVLPGGKAVLFDSVRAGPRSIVVLSLETGETRVLIEDGSFPRYTESGHLLFARERTLFVVPFDLERLSTRGAPVPVLENVGQGGAGEAYYDVSDDGTLVYVSGQTKPETGLSWVDREGTAQPLGPRRRATWSSPRLSPNGELVAASLEPQDAPPDVWLLDTDPATLTRLTTAGGWQSVWAPDGQSLFIQSDARIFRQDLDAAGQAQDVAPCYNLTSISSDGTLAVCQGPNEAGDWDIESVRLDGSG
ncbi:MAG TPA: protein kinase, partial [Vicinamibacteria bacterium]|nr:protein kinase [Vicinamibacteria bacterium]